MAATCGFKGCSNQTYLALPACSHCSKRMCTSHLLPEVHGCGDAEKNESQRQATADAADMRRQRKHLGLDDAKARLDRRRQELAAQRQKKPLKTRQ
ncbi:zinc finger protein [Trypanosoma melophagium]|uniref:zinc finger protein n=1 Tax=Trypanosoma melophagium TaxID=715481 RepID=UPI00351A9F8B|nr:zinc finger protein [Trypanosoma melophagium]KAH9586187.1 zinc finger protein [Trypanosoma melophagium]